LIDIGLNLGSPRFSRDWEDVVARAHAAEVTKFILTGTSMSMSLWVGQLAERLAPGTAYFTAGVHPHKASEVTDDTIAELRVLLAHPLAVSVGETGLDYNRDLSPRPVQRAAFEAQVALACELQKPLFLHERDAAADLLAILGNHKDRLPDCVVHCFTGDEVQAKAYLDRGFYLGVTGWVGQNGRNKSLLRALPSIPSDRLMLETDAPYLTPPGYVPPISGRNEPAAMERVAELVAKVRGVSSEQVRMDAYAATMRFFRLPSDR
jgi:TatD DNase family protein